jgi:hypothetical protein
MPKALFPKETIMSEDEKDYWTDVLIKELEKLGFPKEFGMVLAANLETEYGIRRLAVYVSKNQPTSAEEIADEMLAICDDRDIWRRKKESEYYNSKVNDWLNRERDPEEEK